MNKMINVEQIAPNMLIRNNPGFEVYRKKYVHELLRSIDENFSKALNTEPFKSNICIIDHTPGNPMCSKIISHDYHMIRLHASGNHLTNWAYEFSHEYCHHLINGAFEDDIVGLIWFEEVMCELSSMYNLHHTYLDWSSSMDMEKSVFAHLYQVNLYNLLLQNVQLVAATHRRGWLSSWLPILSQPQLHRDYYNAIAARMLPLFLDNPNLWKIILHFGDSRKWNSLDDLFEHLHSTADESYSHSLNLLSNLLFL